MKKVLMFLSVLVIYSCSHVNHLDEYDLSGESVFFEEVVYAHVAQVSMSNEGNVKTKSKEANIAIDIASSIGKSVVASEIEKKLQKAAHPEKMAKDISRGIETSMVKYFRIQKENELNDKSNFIVTTTLKQVEIISTASGVYAQVEAEVQIIDRNSGKEVWDYSDRSSVGVKRSANTYTDGSTGINLGGIIQTAELASLSEEQLAAAIKNAAEITGRNIAEVLREDYAESRQ